VAGFVYHGKRTCIFSAAKEQKSDVTALDLAKTQYMSGFKISMFIDKNNLIVVLGKM
jgi:hypothetical protein